MDKSTFEELTKKDPIAATRLVFCMLLAKQSQADAMASLEKVVLGYLHLAFKDEIERVTVAMLLRDRIRDGAANLKAHLDQTRYEVALFDKIMEVARSEEK